MTHTPQPITPPQGQACDAPPCDHRRVLLGLAGLLTTASTWADSAPPTAASAASARRWRGKPGEFDWLSGQWRIHNRRRLADGRWDEYPGEATCWGILGGVVHVEELRIPARQFSGMGLRTLDVEGGLWSDYWVNARNGLLGAAGLTGGFEDGVGIFEAEDADGGQPIRYRGQWDRITATACRWQQMSSRDGGRSWDVSWSMAWTRV